MRRAGRGLVILVAAAAVATLLIVSGHNPAPTPAAVVATRQSPAQRTLVLGPGSGFQVDEFLSEPTSQQLTVHDDHGTALIRAYDPGAFDAGRLVREQPIRLLGQDAWLIRADSPALAWRSPGGAWVVVSGAADRASLVRLAGAVRLDPPLEVVGPVALGWVPTGLTLSSARIGSGAASETFTAARRRGYTVQLFVYSVRGNEWLNGTIGVGPTSVVVAGHPGWYFRLPAQSSRLLLEIGSCGVRLEISDRDRMPFSEVERLIAAAAFGSCDTVERWLPILG